jgi:predicted HicB family RNase H-like nuclease
MVDQKQILTACWHAATLTFVRKVTVRISDELFKKLGHYCVDADKSVNEVITDLLEKLVNEGKKTKR